MRLLSLFALLPVVGSLPLPAAPPVPALPRAHAHNDYEHPRPLLDALDQGFTSVEADVHLVDGHLLVAHDRDQVRSGRTLEALYLDPLAERVRTNGGAVYDRSAPFTLWVDIKADPEGSYAALRPLLERHQDLLTRFTDTNRTPGAVTVILSGARPTATVRGEAVRWCALDGRLPDLDANPSPFLYPVVSDNWRPTFSWFRDQRLPEADRRRLRDLVRRAHEQGRQIRFWGVQDEPFAWRELRDAGVDLINTDRLADLRAFLLQPPPRRGSGE
ncbi:MAG: phosphatidylinositol-specific phospholipase C/glycerophosphodiester phosphodiesterase family protein [Verrucomicrobia bacterium]|nr:phosphatidylinositol-specific phospholipase C/glycerophosphodiester phosphodiesterase family protein [Verrucomicrobiota bacterium]